MKATKTEYNGQIFKSKSEAIIQRAFDTSGCFSAVYEAGKELFDPYVPDFKVTSDEFCFFVEYKPSMPTDTYLKRLQDIAMESDKKFCWLKKGNCDAFLLLVGDPFKANDSWYFKPLFSLKTFDIKQFEPQLKNFVNAIPDAKNYRFDLQKKDSFTGLCSILEVGKNSDDKKNNSKRINQDVIDFITKVRLESAEEYARNRVLVRLTENPRLHASTLIAEYYGTSFGDLLQDIFNRRLV